MNTPPRISDPSHAGSKRGLLLHRATRECACPVACRHRPFLNSYGPNSLTDSVVDRSPDRALSNHEDVPMRCQGPRGANMERSCIAGSATPTEETFYKLKPLAESI